MPFRRRSGREEILRLAEAEAERLGVEEYLIVVRRSGALVVISSEDEIESDDAFIGIVTDAKGGAE